MMQGCAVGEISATAAGRMWPPPPPPPPPPGKAAPLRATAPLGALPLGSPGAEVLPTPWLAGAGRYYSPMTGGPSPEPDGWGGRHRVAQQGVSQRRPPAG